MFHLWCFFFPSFSSFCLKWVISLSWLKCLWLPAPLFEAGLAECLEEALVRSCRIALLRWILQEESPGSGPFPLLLPPQLLLLYQSQCSLPPWRLFSVAFIVAAMLLLLRHKGVGGGRPEWVPPAPCPGAAAGGLLCFHSGLCWIAFNAQWPTSCDVL